jgi:DNA polymerase III epsilon subunit-like protein
MTVLIVVDTETTSRYPDKAKVLELAAVVIRDGIIQPECFETMSNPGVEALEGAGEALAVNGITKEEIARAPMEEKAKEKFRAFLSQSRGTKLTSFNIWYDRNVLNNGEWVPEGWEWGDCIMLAATGVMGKAGALPYDRWKKEYRWASLVKATEFFGVETKASHRALGDALAAAEIWLKIMKIVDGGMK